MHIEAVVVRFVHGVDEEGASTLSCHARSVAGSGDVGKLQRRGDEAGAQARVYPEQRARGKRLLARHLPRGVTDMYVYIYILLVHVHTFMHT